MNADAPRKTDDIHSSRGTGYRVQQDGHSCSEHLVVSHLIWHSIPDCSYRKRIPRLIVVLGADVQSLSCERSGGCWVQEGKIACERNGDCFRDGVRPHFFVFRALGLGGHARRQALLQQGPQHQHAQRSAREYCCHMLLAHVGDSMAGAVETAHQPCIES